MSRWTYKKTDNYHVELERGPYHMIAIHVSVDGWSRSLYKELMDVWLGLEEMLVEGGDKEIYGILPKKNKGFAHMFGWSIIHEEDGRCVAKKELV